MEAKEKRISYDDIGTFNYIKGAASKCQILKLILRYLTLYLCVFFLLCHESVYFIVKNI